MLNSLEIRNYRNLKHLRIEKLGRVNLVIGKNNTGKSSLLEAVSLYLNNGDLGWAYELIIERGEDYTRRRTIPSPLSNNIKTLSSLFYGRKATISSQAKISISEDGINSLSIGFVLYVSKTIENPNGNTYQTKILQDHESDPDADLGLQIEKNGIGDIVSLNRDRFRLTSKISVLDKVQLIRTATISKRTNGVLWDRITLSSKEEEVIKALRIIEDRVERMTFIGGEDESRIEQRVPVVKLRFEDDTIPLRSMGDGINRILTIVLAMVNCENGQLLIDEFENGLHYSVQEKLWEIIFELSERLNIQVFVTTHSNDTMPKIQQTDCSSSWTTSKETSKRPCSSRTS